MLHRKFFLSLLSLIFILILTSFFVSAEIGHIESESPYRLSKDFGTLPVSFEENKGQLHSEYYFVARSSQVTSFVTNNGLIVTHHAKNHPIKVEFENAEKQIPYGERPLKGKSNYFVGNDQDKWIRNVSQYKHVVAENIYPGIDVKYHSHGSLLEYDFIVEPGSKVSDIILNVANVDKLVVESSGDLLIHAGDTVLKQHKPYVYQEVDSRKNEIESEYLVHRDNKVSFKVAAYDETIPLIIDPVLEFSTFLGGEAFSHISDIKVDSTGHIYVVGATNSVYYPTANPVQANYGGGDLDAFVTKLSPDGTSIIYSTYFGGSKREGGGLYDSENASVSTSVAVNSAGEAYVAGHTLSNLDFPLVNAYQATFGGGGTDAYLFKLNSTGNTVLFSTYIGGSDDEYFYDVALDSLGNPVAVGHSISTQYPTTTGVIQPSRNAGYNHDGVISKFNTTGSLLLSTYLGGNDDDRLVSVALDSNDNIYVTGETKSTANLPLNNAPQTSHAGNFDMYIAKVNSNGTVLDFGTYWGGSSKDAGRGIALDQTGKIIVVGDSNSSNFPIQSAYQLTKAGNFDVVLVKMSDSGVVDFSTYFGDAQREYGWSVDTDSQNSIFISGMTESINFPQVSPLTEFNTTNTGNYGDAFISKFSADGSTLSFSSKVGGNEADHGFALDVTNQGGVYLAGLTASSNLYTTTNVVQTTLNGVVAGFIVKLQDTVSGIAPDISITSPATSSFLNDNTPTISLTFTDNGGGVDVNSVEIEVNGNLITSTCTGDSVSASCTPDIAIADGQVTISATVADTVGTRSTPDQIAITIDTVLPIITITEPQDGSVTSDSAQIVTGSVNEPTQSLTVNGNAVTPDSGGQYTYSTVILTEGLNTINVIAIDLAGNQSTVTSDVTLNTLGGSAPPDPAIASIFFSGPVNGVVTITGIYESVEANSTVIITNDQTGVSITVIADADGGFIAQLAGSVGDTFSIQAQNTIGSSGTVSQAVGNPINVTITSPVNNSSVATNEIIVSGTSDAPINTGITVNGVSAAITGTPGNYQFTARVPIELGSNTITVSAINFDNLLGQDVVTVISTQELPFKIEANVTQGITQLDTQFMTRTKSNTKIQRIEFDFNDDGITDVISFNYSVPVMHTFAHVGTVFTDITVTTDTGVIFTTSIPITIYNATDIDAVTQDVWSNFTTSINNNDLDTALLSFTSKGRARYKSLFDQLGPDLVTIVNSFSALQASDTEGLGVVSYTIDRTVNGEVTTYPIYFLKNSAGVWRIESM